MRHEKSRLGFLRALTPDSKFNCVVKAKLEPTEAPRETCFVAIRVMHHDTFTREENNLITSAKISFVQAALGAEIEVPTVDGTEKLTITAGNSIWRTDSHTWKRRSLLQPLRIRRSDCSSPDYYTNQINT